MTRRFRLAVLAVSLVVAAGCNSILGIDDHDLASDGEAAPGDDDTGRDAATRDATTGDDAATTAGDAGLDATGGDGSSSCVPGATACSGSSSVQTCGVDGTWSAPLTCATGMCAQGSCAGATTTATSCQGTGTGVSSCGADNESCCTSLEVPTGTYFRSFDGTDGGIVLAADGGPTMEGDLATISGFRLDKYEVTVGRFRAYVAYLGGVGVPPIAGAGKHTHLNGGQGLTSGGSNASFEPGWDVGTSSGYIYSGSSALSQWNSDLACTGPYPTWTPAAGKQDALPVTCPNWPQAYAFCIWDGGFLPSEAEWEYAAAGGAQQRPYAWGTSYPPDSGYSYAVAVCEYPSLMGQGNCVGVSNIAPPGSAALGAGAWGHFDLAGNAWEWTNDYLGALPGPCVNCANLTPSASRVNKGGAFNDPVAYIRTTMRGTPPNGLSGHAANFGFRCARTP